MEQYKELVDILLKMLEEHFQRAEERQQKRNDEDYDEQVRLIFTLCLFQVFSLRF